MTSPKITAIVIAKNEEAMIEDCLASLEFVDKIILIDNGSTDATASLAKKMGATVFAVALKSFAEIRNVALTKVSGGYVLYLDADERVSSALKDEILQVVKDPHALAAYKVPRQNYYLGKHAWPKIEYLERLFKKASLETWQGELHESPVVNGEIGVLHSPILHFTHRDFTSMVEKTNTWSATEAHLRLHAHHPKVTWWRFPRVMLTAFFDSYIKQQGWKIGLPGLLESIYQSFSIFITYAKLWELQQNEQK